MAKKCLVFLVLFLIPLLVNAESVELNGINYNLFSDTKTAEVTNNPNKYSDDVIIPKNIVYSGVKYNVTSIGERAFYGCSKLTSITIPNSVISIGWCAFSGCWRLNSITIPNSVKTIESAAFSGCSGITSIHIPSSVTSFGCWGDGSHNPFYLCGSLASITVDADNPRYDSRNNCNAIIDKEKQILITGCKNTIIPNGVKKIGYAAFHGCYDLKSIIIPNSVTSFEYESFSGCSSLTSFEIPNSVTEIDERTFSSCHGLTSITIPSNVKSIGGDLFSNCRNLTSIVVENDNAKYDSRNNCNAIIEKSTNKLIAGCKSTIIPNSVKSIGYNSMCGFSDITSITIPNSVTEICFGAFQSCGLTSITIPNSITSIGSSAFSGCRGLKSIISEIQDPYEISNVFGSDNDAVYTNATLRVPYGTKSKYQSTPDWNKFTNIEEASSQDSHNTIPEAIDLGLSSGTLWASCNIGASSPEEYGDYFAWGETAPKSNYVWSTYKFGNGANFSKYNSTDGLTELELEDDAAYVILGKDWRMPTHEEELELVNECSWESTTINGISGYKITGPNGNSIFMPRGGLYDGTDYACDGTKLSDVNTCGWYWSSTLNAKGSAYAQGLCFFPSLLANVCDHERSDGHNIRPVYVKKEDVADVVDLGLSVKWASWNVGADKPEGLGNLYAWGELSPKTDYSASTYKFYSGGYTKYGSVDNKYRLDSEDDVAQQNWGDKWRMPTFEELKELKEKCTFTKTELNGVPVTKVVGPNGNYIYFPYPGNYTETSLYFENSIGSYWSSDLESNSYAKDLDFINGMPSLNGDTRYHGQSIRPVYVEDGKVKLNKTKATIEKGKSLTLKATVTPSDLSDKSVTWKSSNTKVATVSSTGKVKGVKTGSATITCTSNATGMSATCEVTVGKVNLDKSEAVILKGTTLKLTPSVYPTTLEDKSVTWESSDPKIATVTSAGKVKGVKTGTATITCTSKATGLSATCEVIVGKVNLDKSEAVIQKGKTLKLTPSVYPTTLEDKSVIWESSNTKIATVSSTGKVKGVKTGTATITCTSNATGLSATCEVTVGKVNLDKAEVSIVKGKTVTLTPIVYPTTLADKSVTWNSSDEAVATVTSGGKVTGIKAGTATITCTSNVTGLSATCQVTVTASSGTRSLSGDDDETTGIDALGQGEAEPYDVYDLSGRKVRHQVTSLDGLPNGVYIVNGRKVLKKE